jgi:hypothetical protein
MFLFSLNKSDTDDAWHVQTRMLSCVRLAKALYQRFTDQLSYICITNAGIIAAQLNATVEHNTGTTTQQIMLHYGTV